MDKGNAGFLSEAADAWDKQCEAALQKEEWISVQAEWYMNNLTLEIVNEALDEQEPSEVMVQAMKAEDWRLVGSCTANMIEKQCYVLAELDYDQRMT